MGGCNPQPPLPPLYFNQFYQPSQTNAEKLLNNKRLEKTDSNLTHVIDERTAKIL